MPATPLRSHSELLHEYFDEGLDSLHEEVLFAELGRNDELRRVFSEMMRLQRAVHSDVARIKAPAADALFDRIAVAPPAQGAARASRQGVPGVVRYAATALSTALLTVLVVLLLDSGDKDFPAQSALRSAASSPAGSSLSVHEQRDAVPHGAVPHGGSSSVPGLDIPISVPDRPAAVRTGVQAAEPHRVPVQRVHNGEAEGEQRNERPVEAIQVASLHAQDGSVGHPVPHGVISARSLPEVPLLSFALPDAVGGGIALVAAGMSAGGGDPKATGQLSVGALYNIDREHAVGLLAGRELFTHKGSIDAGDADVYFSTTEMLPWVLAAYRLSLPAISLEGVVYPFAQLGAGVTRGGVLGKAQIGLVVQPEHRVTLSLGVESTAVWRSSQTGTTVPTLRWVYGIGVRL